MSFVSLYLYVPDEVSLLPKYRDCTTYNDFELYIYICVCVHVKVDVGIERVYVIPTSNHHFEIYSNLDALSSSQLLRNVVLRLPVEDGIIYINFYASEIYS